VNPAAASHHPPARRRASRGVAAALVVLVVLLVSTPLTAQVLRGEWVDRSEQRIEELRKGELRVIVLGRDGRPAANAAVRVEQQQHAFALGVVLAEKGVPAAASELPVWRSLTSVSLDRLADWSRVQPLAAEPADYAAVEAAIADAEARGLTVWWGGLVSADPGRLPDWVAGLRDEPLQQAMQLYVGTTTRRFGRRVAGMDVYTDAFQHAFVQDRLGVAGLRRLYEHAEAAAPTGALALHVRFEDGLTLQRMDQAVRQAIAMRESFIPIVGVTLEQRIGGILAQRPLATAFASLARLGLDVVIAPIEVGGTSASAASVNLETFLRTAFAEPSVRGIYFAGLTADQLADPTGALLDEHGEPTRAGALLDDLFREHWWTDATGRTDHLGNVHVRAFAGVHQVTAALPDGTLLQTRVRVDAGGSRIVVLEPSP
jgi:endo-1,4-beta-xylanase